jgi:hypothetical protein
MLFEVDYRLSLEDLVRLIIPHSAELERSLEEARRLQESSCARRRAGHELVEACIITLGVHMNYQLARSRITQTGDFPNAWELLSCAAADPTVGTGVHGVIALGGSEYSLYSEEQRATLHHVPSLVKFGQHRELVTIVTEMIFGPADRFLVISKRTPL